MLPLYKKFNLCGFRSGDLGDIFSPVFKSKPLSYLTRIFEYCVLKSGVLFLQATSVSGLI